MSWGAVFFALLAIALGVLWLAKRSQAETGLPAGRLIYADTMRWQPLKSPLFSRAHRLTGRPDYVLRQKRDLIPVEIKSGHAPANGPYTSHILQLAAYCLLVEEAYQRHPPYGIILYTDNPDQAYEIDYTPALERELLVILDDMRGALIIDDAPRDHADVARCQACGYRSGCNQSLV
jgi:CRISPR-associated exonuclease Cas4